MANTKKFSVKNGLQTQNIDFVSTDESNTIQISMLDSDTISVSGESGQLFSISDSLTGTLFSVNDVSGMPSIEVLDTGVVKLAEYSGNVLVGTSVDDGSNKVQVNGSVIANTFASTVATGTAPFTVASTTVVTNLNADLLDGQTGSYYLDWTNVTNKPDYVASVAAGSGITVSGTAGEGWTATVAHADTSTQASVDNSNGTVIQDITLDTYGHITALASVDLDTRYVNVTGDTMTGDLTVGATNRAANTTIKALAGDSYSAGFEAYGSAQGTGYLMVGQSASSGGGIFYNGDNSPTFATGEVQDTIGFYRRNASANELVFSYPYNSSTVTFKSNLFINDGGNNSDTIIKSFGGDIVFRADASTDRIGIGLGASAPSSKLHVSKSNDADVVAHGGATMWCVNILNAAESNMTASTIQDGLFSSYTDNSLTSGSALTSNGIRANVNTYGGHNSATNAKITYAVQGRVNVQASSNSTYSYHADAVGIFGNVGVYAPDYVIDEVEGLRTTIFTSAGAANTTITNFSACRLDARPTGGNTAITNLYMIRGVYGGGAPSDTITNSYGIHLGGAAVNHWLRGSLQLGTASAAPTGSTASSVDLNIVDTDSATIRLTSTDTTGALDQMIGQIQFYGSDSDSPGAGVKSKIASYMTPAAGDGSYLTFSTSDGVTNDIERVRIESTGDVNIKQNLIVDGVASATDFNSTSDARLKDNISEIDGLDILNKLNPVSFEWKDSGKKSYGLIAQELESILPELVNERDDGMKGVSYIPIIAMLIDAVKKLDARVKELETK